VIVTQTPGQTDYIEEGVTGIYVPPADSKAFKSAILQLLDNPAEAARLGANALEKFKKDFNLDHYVSLIKEVLDTLMSK
jgi:glycosyltransferase involved in cell wall biosynthesis